MNKRKLLLVLFFSAVCFFFMLNRGFAYSCGMRSVDEFRRESVDIYQLITFNYTVVGTGGEAITAVTTIRSDGQLMEQIQANAIDDLGSENRIEIIPEVKSIWNQKGIDMLLDSRLNYTGVTHYWQRTFIENTTVAYLNLTQAMQSDTLLDQTGHSGYRYQMILLPPEDVATYWCQQHEAVLNSIDNVNLSIDMNSKLVDMLAIQVSEEMEVDDDLSDGYQPVPVAGELAVALAKAFFGFLIKLIFVICAAAVLITWAILDYTPFDFSSSQINNLDQSFHAPEAWNTSEEYQTYIDLCNASGTVPTVEGFIEYLKGLSTTLPDNDPTWNNNFTTPTGGAKNSLTNIIGFISDLLPLIITIIIIVAFVFGIIFIMRGIKSAGSFISPPKKR